MKLQPLSMGPSRVIKYIHTYTHTHSLTHTMLINELLGMLAGGLFLAEPGLTKQIYLFIYLFKLIFH